jgi:hypothetical protein
MNDLRIDTLDAVEARASRRIGLISLALVTGSLLIAMAVAVSVGGGDEAGPDSADCQRSERAVAAAKSAQHAKTETLLLCSSGKSLLQRLF